LKLYLAELGLRLNGRKTRITSFNRGFSFLGYRFDGQDVFQEDGGDGRSGR